VTLLAPDDPVYVIDLTEELAARTEPGAGAAAPAGPATPPPPPPPPPPPAAAIRAVALLVAPDAEPVLLEIPPTRDTVMLDALARVLRVAVRAGATVAAVAAGGDDPLVQRLYAARAFPPFLYQGAGVQVAARLPEAVRRALRVSAA